MRHLFLLLPIVFSYSISLAQQKCLETQGLAKIKVDGEIRRIDEPTRFIYLKKLRPKKKKKSRIYRVETEAGEKAILALRQARFFKATSCFPEQREELEKPEALMTANSQGSRWGFEMTYSPAINTRPLDNIVFPRNRYPLPSGNANETNFDPPYDNISVPDPFVDSIEEGTGYQLGVFYEHSTWWRWYRQKWTLGYWSRSFVAESYPVPNSPSFNSVNSLVRSDIRYDFQAVFLRPEVMLSLFHWGPVGFTFNLGVQLDYQLQETFFVYRVGSNDLVEETLQTGYQTFEVNFFPRIEAEYSGFRIGLEFMNPQEGLAMSLTLGYAL